MTDIEIAERVKPAHIKNVAKKLGLKSENLDLYGTNKAKIKNVNLSPKGKLVLVTSINPTASGEGKTTISIGLADGLSLCGKRVCLALREPSLGPVFGIKGGATGGGQSQIIPMDEINLHFTGDFHAITSANNLLCAMIDNHIFQGNELDIDENNIMFNRCLDVNDRALRNVTVSQEGLKTSVPRAEKFNITSASEVMAVLSLSENIIDLKTRLGNILVAFAKNGNPIFARDLKAENAMALLLKDALKPNLVQTLAHTPVIVHCGPFANIAHGCNSIIATKMALTLSDYCVTEAGFGADLGAEKFLDLKCKLGKLNPDVVVVVATVRALKLHGGADKNELAGADISYLRAGLPNLRRHIENLKNVFNKRVVCAINKFADDKKEELDLIKELCTELSVSCEVADVHGQGGKGAKALAKVVIEECDKKKLPAKYSYNLADDIATKTRDICQKVYHAKDIVLSEKAKNSLLLLEPLAKNYPVCVAKTQYSFSPDPKLLGAPENFVCEIKDFEIRNGAGFVVAVAGSIMLMPGLSKTPAAVKMKIDKNLKIEGLF